MRDSVQLTGIVIRSAPVGEFDKRLVILTKERGKIVAFAKGARRPGNALMAPSRPFSFGVFQMFESRDSYRLFAAEITNYFQDLTLDIEKSCYGQYFLEFVDYYSRENIDGTEMLQLLYLTLKALINQKIPNQLIQRIFELRVMVVNGEYTQHPPMEVSVSANYTWEYVIGSQISSLYTFILKDDVFHEFKRCVDRNKAKFIDREFHSLEILESLG